LTENGRRLGKKGGGRVEKAFRVPERGVLTEVGKKPLSSNRRSGKKRAGGGNTERGSLQKGDRERGRMVRALRRRKGGGRKRGPIDKRKPRTQKYSGEQTPPALGRGDKRI